MSKMTDLVGVKGCGVWGRGEVSSGGLFLLYTSGLISGVPRDTLKHPVARGKSMRLGVVRSGL